MAEQKKGNFKYVIFLSVVGAIGGFLFGYDTAVISGTIQQVTYLYMLNDVETGWYVGCALIGLSSVFLLPASSVTGSAGGFRYGLRQPCLQSRLSAVWWPPIFTCLYLHVCWEVWE